MRFKTLQQWLDWQEQLHPSEIELGLERVSQVWQSLHDAPFPVPVVTVAGTNGKGSSVALLDAIARAAGYRVGCYTSPHLIRYNERIRIDGEELSDERICQAFQSVDEAREGTPLTYFEFGTLAALEIFASADLDLVILEVGLGGRLDAVNIIDPDVALITTVDIDHAEWLGSDRESIGREKAGIMRPDRPVVSATPEPPGSVLEHAENIGATLHLAGRDFGYRNLEEGWTWWSGTRNRHSLPQPYLRGRFQLQNASAVLMVLELLADRLPVDQRAVRAGLQSVRVAGRFEILDRDPLVVLDVAHNREAATGLASNLQDLFCSGDSCAVFAMLADKDLQQVVEIMRPRIDHWFCAPLPGPRSLGVKELAAGLMEAGVEETAINRCDSLATAYREARSQAGPEGRVVVFGSFLTVGGVLELNREIGRTD
ncbi:MAG: bifunctional tetrahydrofolate synthase/dihydrofolate synthase [Sedimenticola sp.]